MPLHDLHRLVRCAYQLFAANIFPFVWGVWSSGTAHTGNGWGRQADHTKMVSTKPLWTIRLTPCVGEPLDDSGYISHSRPNSGLKSAPGANLGQRLGKFDRDRKA